MAGKKVIMFGVEPIWLVVAIIALLVMIFGWGVLTRPFGIERDEKIKPEKPSK